MTKSFWAHFAATIGGVAITILSPQVQSTLANHPVISSVVGGIWAAIGALISPKAS